MRRLTIKDFKYIFRGYCQYIRCGKVRYVSGYNIICMNLFCAFILQAIFKVGKAFFLQSVFYVFMVSARHLQQVQQIKEKLSPVCG